MGGACGRGNNRVHPVDEGESGGLLSVGERRRLQQELEAEKQRVESLRAEQAAVAESLARLRTGLDTLAHKDLVLLEPAGKDETPSQTCAHLERTVDALREAQSRRYTQQGSAVLFDKWIGTALEAYQREEKS